MVIAIRAFIAAALAVFVALALRAIAPAVLTSNVDAVAGFLHVFGAIYGTVLAFLIFVVWGQFNGTEAGVAREARALQELVRLCRAGRGQGCREVVEAVHTYGRFAAEDEWKLLGQGKPCPSADDAFLKVQEAVLKTNAGTEIELLTRDTVIRVAERAAALRSERLALSSTRIPPTLWRTVLVATAVLGFSVCLLGTTEPALTMYLSGGFTLVATLILGVVADMDNPFDGVYNASNAPLKALVHV
ncbi:MAG: DUF4239 domain-containing protein [Deltaproteobacteria bacterium]|nr:DUF4239 domain-containing protein [Deltaproteobacteria bacterium]